MCAVLATEPPQGRQKGGF